MSRLFVRPLQDDVKADVEDLFGKYGKLLDVAVKRGYGFVEFAEESSAKDAIDALNNSEFQGQEITVELANSRPPSTRKVATHRLRVTGLGADATWTDLKDFVRDIGVEPAFTNTSNLQDGTGIVDVSSQEEADKLISELSGKEVRGHSVTLEIDPEGPQPPPRRSGPGRFDGGRRGGRGDRRGGFRGDRRGGFRGDRDGRRGGFRDRDSRGGYDRGRDRDSYQSRDRQRSRSPPRQREDSEPSW